MNKKFLSSHLNNFVGSGYAYVWGWALRSYGNSEWDAIREALSEWESKGFLKVLKDPEQCADNEICLEMFNFIDAEEPLPNNWLSKDRMAPRWPEGMKHTPLKPPFC